MQLPSTLRLFGIALLLGASVVQTPAQVEFRPAGDCALCHSNAPTASAMRDADGAPIAPFNLWHSSPMANAGRDPLWKAVVSAEIATFPEHREEIASTCTRCHTPIAWWRQNAAPPASAATNTTPVQDAAEGVSCTVCHQIPEQELGHPNTFSGRYHLAEGTPAFGPHPNPFDMPMRMHTGFNALHSEHVLQSALCSACHTLFTEPLGGDPSTPASALAEQAPFLEWRLSAFSRPGPDARTCQDCHMPNTDGDGQAFNTRIARNPMGRDFPPTLPRQPFAKHLLAGANTILPALAAAAGSDVTPEEWSWRKETSQFILQQQTAKLQLTAARAKDGGLLVEVTIHNRAGHKFPTAHPSRRAWLEITVSDQDNNPIFTSGHSAPSGAILGAHQQPLPSELPGGPIQPHYLSISHPDQVQVYQSIMADADKDPTFRLLAGQSYIKDNRIPPVGWDPAQAAAQDLGSPGTEDDSDFAPGRDTIQYHIPAPQPPPRTWQIQTRLRYQNLSYRFAAELFTLDTPDIQTLQSALNGTLPTETLAEATLVIR